MTESTRPVAILVGTAAAVTFPLWYWFFRPVGGGIDVTGYIVGRDFLPMWAAPRLAVTSGVASLTDLPAFSAELSRLVDVPGVSAIWSYPPTALLLLLPFSVPSYWVSLAIWTALGWVVYAVSALSLRGSRPRAPILLLLAASPAAWIDTGTGQNGFVMAALLLGGFANIRARPLVAGILFGLMTVKPHIGVAVAVALVAIGAWRTIAAAVLTAAVLTAAATWLFGLEAWQGHVTIAAPYGMRALSATVSGYRLLLVSLTSALAQGGLTMGWALALQGAVAVSALAVLWLAARRTADPLRLVALVAAATPLVSPYIWTYDLVALGAVLALRFSGDPGRCPPWILALGYLSPALSMVFQIVPGIAVAPALLGLVFAALIREATGQPRHEHAPGRAGGRAGPAGSTRGEALIVGAIGASGTTSGGAALERS